MSFQGSKFPLDERAVIETTPSRRSKRSSGSIDNSYKPSNQNRTRTASNSMEPACEQCKAGMEYNTVMQNALREVLEQNDALRARVAELEAIISQAEDEDNEKNRLIAELQRNIKVLIDESKQRRIRQ